MGSQRITEKDIQSQINIINEMYKNRGVNVVLKSNPRNGCAGVDYNKNGSGTMTLICMESNRNTYNQLETLINGIQLMG